MKRTAKASTSFVQKINPYGHSDGGRDREKTRKEEERRENKIKVQQSVAHEAAYGGSLDNPYGDNSRQPVVPHPQGQSPEKQPSKQKRDAHYIKRKPPAPRDDSHSQQNDVTRSRNQQRTDISKLGGGFDPLQPEVMSPRGQSYSRGPEVMSLGDEPNFRRPEKKQPRDESSPRRAEARRPKEPNQDFRIGQLKTHKPPSSRREELWFHGADDKAQNRDIPPVEFISSKRTLNPLVIPRVKGAGDTSENWQSQISREIETAGSGEEDSDSNAVVERIIKQLRKAKIEHPSEHFRNDIPKHGSIEDVEKALHDLIRAYGSVCQSAYESEDALSTRTTEYTFLKTRYDDEWAKWANANRDLKAEVLTLTEEVRRERERTSFVRDEYAIREKGREAITVDNEVRIKRLESEVEQSKSKHESEISRLRKNHLQELTNLEITTEQMISTAIKGCDSRLNDLTKEHEAEKRQMALHHQESVAGLERSFREEKTALKNSMETAKYQHQIQFVDMQKKHELEISRKDEEIESIGRGHKAETERMKELHQAEMNRMKESHEDEKIELENKREEEHRSLRNDVVALTGALVKRDHFKPMSDHELARRFQNIASEADEFARVRWDNRRESTWPFTDRVLRNSENERRTKQYIVQNTVWVILYERIFCSPFQIFGSKGRSLAQDWIKQYGQDRKSTGALAICPKPTKDSEKWRYETMKQCLDDIGQSPPEQKSNHNLKQDYELSLSAVIDDMCHELERVASMSSSDKQRMSDFVRKAAKLWLEVGQQRYRVFLLMSDTGEIPSRSGSDFLNNDGTQDLIVTPELRRLGNAQGERLERDELVRDCKGKFSLIQAR